MWTLADKAEALQALGSRGGGCTDLGVGEISSPQGLGENGLGAGRGPPQGSLQELVHLGLPLFLVLGLLSLAPRLPAVSRVGVGVGLSPTPVRGLQAVPSAWVPPSPPPCASSSPARCAPRPAPAARPAFTLRASLQPPARRILRDAMLRLGQPSPALPI
jgi:hypothetical protein